MGCGASAPAKAAGDESPRSKSIRGGKSTKKIDASPSVNRTAAPVLVLCDMCTGGLPLCRDVADELGGTSIDLTAELWATAERDEELKKLVKGGGIVPSSTIASVLRARMRDSPAPHVITGLRYTEELDAFDAACDGGGVAAALHWSLPEATLEERLQLRQSDRNAAVKLGCFSTPEMELEVDALREQAAAARAALAPLLDRLRAGRRLATVEAGAPAGVEEAMLHVRMLARHATRSLPPPARRRRGHRL